VECIPLDPERQETREQLQLKYQHLMALSADISGNKT
jgi:hypothetical protein